MPNRGFLYHKNRPEGQLYEDLTPELQAQLEGEGWVDTPAKLPQTGEGVLTQGEAVARATPAAMTLGDGRALGTEGKAPVPTPADLRFAQLFDDTGAPVHGDISDDDLFTLVSSMSIEELHRALEMTGAPPLPADAQPHDWREALHDALRPPEEKLDQTDADAVEKKVEEMTEDEREAWLTSADTTKAMMQAVLDERKVPYKARDGREELQEAIRLSFAPKE